MLERFQGLSLTLYEPEKKLEGEVAKDTMRAYNNLSKTFGYSPGMPKTKLVNIPRTIIGYIIDPVRGAIHSVVSEVGGAYDRFRNRIYLNKEKIRDGVDRISIIYHEVGHKFLDRFRLPRDVEEGYASWLTKKLTGYAKDAYGELRNRFEGVYQKLGNKIYNPNNRDEIINEFYGYGN